MITRESTAGTGATLRPPEQSAPEARFEGKQLTLGCVGHEGAVLWDVMRLSHQWEINEIVAFAPVKMVLFPGESGVQVS